MKGRGVEGEETERSREKGGVGDTYQGKEGGGKKVEEEEEQEEGGGNRRGERR